MRVAAQFIKQLQEGKTTEAITTLKTALFENAAVMIDESRIDVITSYGFQIDEKKKMKEEKDEKNESESDEDEDEDESDDEDSEKEKEEDM